MIAIDTNVLIYFIDRNEPSKQKIAIELMRELGAETDRVVLPWQVGVEFLSCLRRWENAGRISRQNTLLQIQQLESTFSFVFPSPKVLTTSLDISFRFQVSHWDSLLLAACLEAGVTTLYSEDLSHAMTYDFVKVINPFR